MSKIRPIAICVIQRGDQLLLFQGFDSHEDPEIFYRPLGGGVEFGEHSSEAVRREIREELGAEIDEPRLLGVLENVFDYQGEPRHEIVFVYEAGLADRSILERDAPPAVEADGSTMKTCWKTPAEIAREGARLVPEGLIELI